MANETLILGDNNWAVKTSNLLGYAVGESSGDYVPREFTFSRNSTATYTDENGVVQTAAANSARVQDGALLIEPQRTNSVLNSSMVGAVAGSPGTAPTGWAFNGGGGLTRTISLGTENDLPYIDFRFQGTATQTFLTILPTPSNTSASATQSWNFSLYAKLISGTPPTLRLNILASGGTAQTQLITLTSSLQRFDNTFLNLPVGTTSVRPYLDTNALSIGTTYDFTIRIAAPQFEQGSYATTYIPTTNATATRLVDVCTETNISSLIGQSEGTLFAEIYYRRLTTDFGVTALMLINTDGSFQNRIQLGIDQAHKLIAVFTNSSTGQNVVASSTNIQEGVHKLALKYTTTECKLFLDGVLVQTTALTIFPVASLGVLKIGNNFSNATPINNGVKIASIYDKLLTDEELILKTTL